jgi:hypothetical protein
MGISTARPTFRCSALHLFNEYGQKRQARLQTYNKTMRPTHEIEDLTNKHFAIFLTLKSKWKDSIPNFCGHHTGRKFYDDRSHDVLIWGWFAVVSWHKHRYLGNGLNRQYYLGQCSVENLKVSYSLFQR